MTALGGLTLASSPLLSLPSGSPLPRGVHVCKWTSQHHPSSIHLPHKQLGPWDGLREGAAESGPQRLLGPLFPTGSLEMGHKILVGTAIAHTEISPREERQRLQGGGCLKSAGPRAGALFLCLEAITT